jgi:DNA-binding XRE family transcriptional regulator
MFMLSHEEFCCIDHARRIYITQRQREKGNSVTETKSTPRAIARSAFERSLQEYAKALDLVGKDPSKEDFAWAFGVAARAGLPQDEVSKAIGVNQGTVSRWSRGESLPPNAIVRDGYLQALRVCFANFMQADATYAEPGTAAATQNRRGRRASATQALTHAS